MWETFFTGEIENAMDKICEQAASKRNETVDIENMVGS